MAENYFRIHLKNGVNLYSFIKTDTSKLFTRDGSFYFFTDGYIQHHKISYHVSGEVNSSENKIVRNRFEPVSDLTKPNVFCQLLIKNVSALKPSLDSHLEREISIFDVTALKNKNVLISFLLAPSEFSYEGFHALKCDFSPAPFSFVLVASDGAEIAEKLALEEKTENFVWISPKKSFIEPTGAEIVNCEIKYFDKLTKTNGVQKILGPNNEGAFHVVFSRSMRAPPKIFIDPSVASKYKLEILEVQNGIKAISRASVKFKMKYVKGGGLIKDPKDLPPIFYDARF